MHHQQCNQINTSAAAKTVMLVACGKLSRSRGTCIGVVQPHAGPD